MLISLYRNKSANNVINKELQLVGTDTINIKRDSSFIRLTVDLKYTSLIDFNYAYIPDLNRYYFVTDFENLTNDIVRIELEIDVLMTYKSLIMASNLHITTGESELPLDSNVTKGNDETIYSTNFTIPFNRNGSIILVC